MSDIWTRLAVKLRAELNECGIDLNASVDEITTCAGGWFVAMGDDSDAKSMIIEAMRNLPQSQIEVR